MRYVHASIFSVILGLFVLACGTASSSKEGFYVYSPAFPDGGEIPVKYTCDGQNISIPIKWDNVPEGTKSFVVIMCDPDANRYTHWVVYDIPANYRELKEGISGNDINIKEGANDNGSVGYFGPCPPKGDPAHTYMIHLYALKVESLNLSAGALRNEVEEAMKGKIIQEVTYTGKYKAQ